MAEGIKISEMETIEALKNSCLFPLVDDGVNKKVSFETLKDFMVSMFYPVGARIVSTTDPSTWLSGTTWSNGYKYSGAPYADGVLTTDTTDRGVVKSKNNPVYEWTRTA